MTEKITEMLVANRGHPLRIESIEKSPFYLDHGDIAHWETNCIRCKKPFHFFTLWPLNRAGGESHRTIRVSCVVCSGRNSDG